MTLSGLDWLKSLSASLSTVKKLLPGDADSALLWLSLHSMNLSWLKGLASLFSDKELAAQVKDPVITVLLSRSVVVAALE